jgi:hypothetical protein
MAINKQTLWHANTLAEFSNMKSAELENFRIKYPDFVPQKWWDYTSTSKSGGDLQVSSKKQWEFNQGILRDAWKQGFAGGLFFILRLTTTVFDPDQLEAVLWGDPNRPWYASMDEMAEGTFPYQEAVLMLYQEPWRARFCAQCQNRFVAAESKTKYCSDVCSHKSRNRQKRYWFKHSGSRQRADRRKKAVRVKKPARIRRNKS